MLAMPLLDKSFAPKVAIVNGFSLNVDPVQQTKYRNKQQAKLRYLQKFVYRPFYSFLL